MVMTYLIAFVIALAQLPAVTVTFPPTPMPAALEVLSKHTGHRLTASKVFLQDVVLARLQSAPVDTVLGDLADAFCAKWRTQPDGSMQLIPDSATAKRVAAVQAAQDRKSLEKALHIVENLLTKKVSELAQAGMKAAHEDLGADFGPGWRATARLALCFGVDRLQAVPAQTLEVYAESPSPMQHEFPKACDAVLNAYRADLAKAGVQGVRRIKMAIRQADAGEFANGPNVMITVTALDAGDQTVDSGFLNLPVDLLDVETGGDAPAEPGGKPIELGVDTLDMRLAFAGESATTAWAKAVLKWRSNFSDPVRVEPMQWHEGADLVAAATEDHRNLIGTVNDVLGNRESDTDPLSPGGVWKKYAQDLSIAPDGVIVVRSRIRTGRISRSEAKSWMQECLREGGVGIDSAATWAAKSPEEEPFSLWIGDYMDALFPGPPPYSVYDTFQTSHLRLWAELGEEVREALKRGQSVRWGDLPSEARTELIRLVYAEGDSQNDAFDFTDLLPGGITGGMVSMKTTETTVFEGWNSKSTEPTIPMPIDARMLGIMLASDKLDFAGPKVDVKNWDRFRLGIHRALDLQFTLQPDNVPLKVDLSETFVDPAAETVTDLPAPIRAEVERARQAQITRQSRSQRRSVVPPN